MTRRRPEPPTGLAAAIEAAVQALRITPSEAARINEPDERDVRRQALGRDVPSEFREALRLAGWHRSEIRAWIRTGALPTRALRHRERGAS